jgi:hypothetical protein
MSSLPHYGAGVFYRPSANELCTPQNQSRIRAASSEMASRIVSIKLKKRNKTYQLKVMIQFVSHVLPASSENACSKWLEFGVMAEKPLRTMMILPWKSSWS